MSKSSSAPVFRPISAPLDVPDDALQALGDRLGVPTMVKPEAKPVEPVVVESSPVSSLSVQQPPAPVQKALETLAEVHSDAPCPEEKLTVFLPSYLMRDIRRSCVEQRATMRYMVLSALKTAGFSVREEDLVPDFRRVKSN